MRILKYLDIVSVLIINWLSGIFAWLLLSVVCLFVTLYGGFAGLKKFLKGLYEPKN
jgi:hypothetical protein